MQFDWSEPFKNTNDFGKIKNYFVTIFKCVRNYLFGLFIEVRGSFFGIKLVEPFSFLIMQFDKKIMWGVTIFLMLVIYFCHLCVTVKRKNCFKKSVNFLNYCFIYPENSWYIFNKWHQILDYFHSILWHRKSQNFTFKTLCFNIKQRNIFLECFSRLSVMN